MSSTFTQYDVLLIGGGVIGLSLAWELAQAGAKTCLVDRGELGREASWASAGMIPPGPAQEMWENCNAIEQLAALSEPLHQNWHAHLLETTGIDNGYRLTGAIHFEDAPNRLSEKMQAWSRLGISYCSMDAATLIDIAPGLSKDAARREAVFLPGEAQVRSPRHLKALIAACQLAGVDLCPGSAVQGFTTSGNRIVSAKTSNGEIPAGEYCLTTGCWSALVAEQLSLQIPAQPVLGQILLLNGPPALVRHITNVGRRYLTPRPDGRVLVGSTEEDVGFHKRNTVAGLAALMNFAVEMYPAVANLAVEQSWSGLRPGTPDELPVLGRLPCYDNAWIAAGHFRGGIQLSPATAQVMRSLILEQEPPVDVTSLGVERYASPAS